MKIDDSFFDRFLDNLSDMMGEKCEIVVHDFSNGFEHTIVRIINNLTGRMPGDAPTNLFFEKYQESGFQMSDMPVYFTRFSDGRIFKSCTTFIRDGANNVTGAVCINMDVTDLLHAARLLSDFTDDTASQQSGELYVHTLDELMDHYLEQVERAAGKRASEMDKEEKLKALDYLDKKGVLHMAKSSIRLCEFFDFSKFTLYNYLDELRKNRDTAKSEKTPDSNRETTD